MDLAEPGPTGHAISSPCELNKQAENTCLVSQVCFVPGQRRPCDPGIFVGEHRSRAGRERGCEFAMLVRPFAGRALGALANARRANCSRFDLASRGVAMKPTPFDYQAPVTLREAIDLLASNPEAFVIAGGQSLMPVLAFRLATPSLLVDLRRLPGLGNIVVGDDGVRLGALVRWRDIEDDEGLVAAQPLLHAAVAHVAHYQIRNRGTVGGSLAHADPAAELPGVAVTCAGDITLFGPAGCRTERAGDFFTGPLSTLRQPDEIVTELHLPKWPSGRRWAFRKYARHDGDFALAGILLFYDEDW